MAGRKDVSSILVSDYDGYVTVYHKNGSISQYEGWGLCPKYIQDMESSAQRANCFHPYGGYDD